MGIIKCCECGHSVSEYAEKCQNCGCPINIIKENQNIKNCDRVIFKGNKEINIPNMTELFPEEELNNKNKFWDFLMSKYKLSMGESGVLCSIIEFNNYKYPDDIQKTYEDMCARNRARRNSNVPHCPTCGSTNISKISTSAKLAGAIGFGLLSKTAKSQFKCNKCGYKW